MVRSEGLCWRWFSPCRKWGCAGWSSGRPVVAPSRSSSQDWWLVPVLASPSFYKDGSNAGKTILQCKTVTTVGLLKRSDNTETGCDLIRRFQNIMFLQGFALSHIDQTPDKRIQLLPPSEAVDVWLAAARPQLLLSLPLSPPGSAEAGPRLLPAHRPGAGLPRSNSHRKWICSNRAVAEESFWFKAFNISKFKSK